MALDLSQRSSDEIQIAYNTLQRNPERFANNTEYRRALEAEYNRRFGATRAQSAPTNVDANLAASAAPIAVEPIAGDQLRPRPTREQMDEALIYGNVQANGQPAGPGGGLGIRNTPEDLAVYGEVVRDAYGRTIDRGVARRQEARAAGYQDPEQLAYNAETGVMPASAPLGDTVMVDGVEVPVRMRDGAGRPMTTIGDERRAMEAAAEADWLARFRANQDADRQKYGGYDTPVMQLTGAQVQNRVLRQDAERRQRAQYEDIRAAKIANANRPLTPYEQEQKVRRDRYSEMARLAGGSSGLRGGRGGNMGSLQALAMLRGVDPDNMDARQRNLAYAAPGGALTAEVDKAGAENALRMLQGINLGQGLQNNPLVAAQAEAAGIQAQAAKDAARAPDEDVLGNKYAPAGYFGYDEFTVAEQQQMYDDLIRRGYTPPEAQRAVDAQADKRRATERSNWGD